MSSFKTFNGYEVEDAYARECVGELSKVAPAIGMVEGTGVTIIDSTEGMLVDLEVNGRSTQTQYSGKNLANVKDKTSGTVEGITSSIANEVVTASGTSTGNGDIPIELTTNLIMESGTEYTLSLQEQTGTLPNYVTVYIFDDLTTSYADYKTLVLANSAVFTFDSEVKCSRVLLRINLNNTINGTFRLQIERGATKTAYEPYCGGVASPNPSYPQAIKSVGDMGYFDGELLQGAYNSSNGEITTNATYLCSKNFIPCNAGDEITLKYATSMRVVNLLYYDESKTFITSSTAQTNVDKYTATAPTNAKYFKFNISESLTAITVSDAKHICVTINDKYALIVDSVGKNELQNTATEQTINGVTFKVNEDKSITVNGTATANVELVIGSFNAEVGSYILNGCPNGVVNSGIRLYDGVTHKASDTGNSVAYEVTTKTTLKSSIFIGSGVTLNNLTFYPMIRPLGTDATYEPYIHSRKYIPISAPLRGIGEVTDVASLSECEVDRKFAEVVFDGSDDEDWNVSGGFAIISVSDAISTNSTYGELICSHFKYNGQSSDIGNCFNYNQKFHFAIEQTTLAEFKSWLQANPITVIYELAEPTTERIELIDVDTFEGVTHISVSDNANCEVVYYRNNEDGKKMKELDNRIVTAEDTINNLESNAVAVAGDIEDIKASMSENPLLVTLAPTDELPTITAGSTVGSFKDTWLNRVINDYEYLIIVIRHRNGTKQIVQIPSMLIEIGGTYTFPFNDVQNNINGAYITINSATRYGIGIFGTLPNDISFELYKYGRPISVG